MGEVVGTTDVGGCARVEIGAPAVASMLELGDSVSVSGVCLTATAVADGVFIADVMVQTLRMTTLGGLSRGDAVNLELPLAAGERFGGHFVQGHVDGVATVQDVASEGFSRRVHFSIPPGLEECVADQGSIALDGVSLTVAETDGRRIAVSLIPETIERTTLGAAKPGDRVNVEVDVLAKLVSRSVSRILGRGEVERRANPTGRRTEVMPNE